MMPKIEVFKAIAKDYKCLPEQPEKEKFLMQLLKHFAEELSFDEGRLVFGGGTSLARAYKVLRRFSEDGDFRFIPFSPLKKTKPIRLKLTNFIKSLKDLELLDEPRNDSKKIKFELDYAKHPEFSRSGALRSHIQIEIYFSKSLRYPTNKLSVGSLYNEYEKLPPETEFDCVALEETAIDKLSALLWRIESKKDYHPSDMRHLHDIALLKNSLKVDSKFKETLIAVYAVDIKRRTSIEMPLPKRTDQIINTLKTNEKYAKNYKQYVDEMVYGRDNEKLSFEKALDGLQNLIKEMNF